MKTLRRLWAGEIPLTQAFWTFAVLYGLVVNLATTAAALALFSQDAPTALGVLVYLAAMPYNVLVVVAVWRSAARYTGPRHWPDLARVAVIAWVVVLTIV